MTLPVPLNRTELYLAKIAGEDVTPPEPQSRQEMFLAKLAGADIVLPEPLSLTEQWLALCAGMAGVTAPEIEGACLIGVQKVDVRFFAVASGLDGVTAPEPQNRTEEFWAKIAEEMSVKTITVKGTDLHLLKVVSGIDDLQYVYGDTTQQSYSGKNLFDVTDKTADWSNNASVDADGWITVTGEDNAFTNLYTKPSSNISTSTTYYAVVEVKSVVYDSGTAYLQPTSARATSQSKNSNLLSLNNITAGQTYVLPFETVADFTGTTTMLRTFVYTATAGSSITFRLSVVAVNPNPNTFIYEPYVGGIPSPNPDYPQDVQVVTGEQTVTISDGANSHNFTMNLKTANLFDSATVVNGNLQANGTVNTSAAGYSTTDFIEIDSSLPIIKTATGSPRVKLYDSSKNVISTAQYNDIPNFNTSGSHDITYKNAKYIRFSIYLADYPLDGVNIYQPIELAKIGTYEDYIYKSGSDWYVHKAIKKVVLDGTTGYYGVNTDSANTTRVVAQNTISDAPAVVPIVLPVSDYFIGKSMWSVDEDGVYATGNDIVFRGEKTTIGTTSDAVKAWLLAHTPAIYYILATPTDTQITDTDLIAQLNALDSAILPTPEAFVTVSGNLPAPIQFTYKGKE